MGSMYAISQIRRRGSGSQLLSVPGADLFDSSFFSLSAAEATTIDPQQRLLLEAAQVAFAASATSRDQLMGREVGIFVGQCQYDWLAISSMGDKFSAYSGTGMSAAISANRVSYRHCIYSSDAPNEEKLHEVMINTHTD